MCASNIYTNECVFSSIPAMSEKVISFFTLKKTYHFLSHIEHFQYPKGSLSESKYIQMIL